MAGIVSYKLLAFTSLVLFVAIAPLPYGYYTFMRIVVCGASAYIAYQLVTENKGHIWPWLFGLITILFNPIIVIHMSKETWMLVDGLACILFGYLAWREYKEQKSNTR